MHIRRIFKHELPRVEAFYLSLSDADRYNRFCGQLSSFAVSKYVLGIDLTKNVVVAAFDSEGRMLGVAEANMTDDTVEGAFAVSAFARGRGLGKALVDRVVLEGKLAGKSRYVITCLANNRAMVHLAQRIGMKLTPCYPEMEASISLEEASLQERLSWLTQQFFEQAGYTSVAVSSSMSDFACAMWQPMAVTPLDIQPQV